MEMHVRRVCPGSFICLCGGGQSAMGYIVLNFPMRLSCAYLTWDLYYRVFAMHENIKATADGCLTAMSTFVPAGTYLPWLASPHRGTNPKPIHGTASLSTPIVCAQTHHSPTVSWQACFGVSCASTYTRNFTCKCTLSHMLFLLNESYNKTYMASYCTGTLNRTVCKKP
jgi:hypothetical protein